MNMKAIIGMVCMMTLSTCASRSEVASLRRTDAETKL
jgi:hypothetical protein